MTNKPRIRQECILGNKHCLEDIKSKNVSELIHEQLSNKSEVVGGSEVDQFAHSIRTYTGDLCKHCKVGIYEKLSVTDKQL